MTSTTTRKRPRRTKYSREAAPIGEIRVRFGNGSKGNKPARYIKVRMDGPQQERWMLYARWLWEAHNGPVPDGHRIAHADGDMMNDDYRNLVCVTPGDIAFMAHDRDPKMSRRNYEKASKATARTNRERGIVNRALNWLPTRWYAVFPSAGQIWNEPTRKAISLRRLCGITADWRVARSASLGWAGRDLLEACILSVLSEHDLMTNVDVITSIGVIRDLSGWSRAKVGSVHSAICRLKASGLVEGGRGVCQLSPMADLERTRKTPVLLVKGERLDAGLFADFEKVDRVSGVCIKCGCHEHNACYDELRGPCWWVESDLCSHCEGKVE